MLTRLGVCMWIWIIRCPAFWLIVLRMHFRNKSRRRCSALLAPVVLWVCCLRDCQRIRSAIATSWWQQLQLHVFNCKPYDVNETNYNKLRQLLLDCDRFIRHKMKLLCNFSPVRTLDLFWISPQLSTFKPLRWFQWRFASLKKASSYVFWNGVGHNLISWNILVGKQKKNACNEGCCNLAKSEKNSRIYIYWLEEIDKTLVNVGILTRDHTLSGYINSSINFPIPFESVSQYTYNGMWEWFLFVCPI